MYNVHVHVCTSSCEGLTFISAAMVLQFVKFCSFTSLMRALSSSLFHAPCKQRCSTRTIHKYIHAGTHLLLLAIYRYHYAISTLCPSPRLPYITACDVSDQAFVQLIFSMCVCVKGPRNKATCMHSFSLQQCVHVPC